MARELAQDMMIRRRILVPVLRERDDAGWHEAQATQSPDRVQRVPVRTTVSETLTGAPSDRGR
jgi:hypothetical protein